MYQVWELAKYQAEHRSIEVDWQNLTPISGIQILITVGSIINQNLYSGEVFHQMLNELIRFEDDIFAWTALEMLSGKIRFIFDIINFVLAALMENLNPLLRKKLLKTLSKWCQKSHNSQVQYFLCQILIQMRQSEDDILKRFSVLQLKKLDTKNDQMFTYARKCPSADIVTRINIRLI